MSAGKSFVDAWEPRAAYRELRAYDIDPVAPRCDLELADNTSQFGAPPAALRALREFTSDRLARYPSTYSRELREAIADYVGAAPDEIMVGAGSDDVLSCTFRALAEPGDRVAYMDPTFIMARVFALTNSLCPVPVTLLSDYDADADAIVATAAPLVYLCAPNNPTGTPVSPASLDHVLNTTRPVRGGGLTLVDEAYAEYAGTNLAARAPAHGRMLVYRTFSKAFGLAGMRVGFAVGARRLIAELEKARGPFSVTALSEKAALAALREDRPWVARCVNDVRTARDTFIAALCAAGYAPLNSAANFVLVPVPDARAAMHGLRARGILVRHFAALPAIGDALRITIGRAPDMQRVLTALREVSPCG